MVKFTQWYVGRCWRTDQASIRLACVGSASGKTGQLGLTVVHRRGWDALSVVASSRLRQQRVMTSQCTAAETRWHLELRSSRNMIYIVSVATGAHGISLGDMEPSTGTWCTKCGRAPFGKRQLEVEVCTMMRFHRIHDRAQQRAPGAYVLLFNSDAGVACCPRGAIAASHS